MSKYCKKLTVGRDADGNRIQKRFYGNTKAELERAIFEYRKGAEQITDHSNPSFGDYADKWLNINAEVYAESTYRVYSVLLQSKFEDVRPLAFKQVQLSDLQKVISANSDHPRECQVLRKILNNIYVMAVHDGLIARNPCEGLKLPAYSPSEKRPLTDSERRAVFSANFCDYDRLLVLILYNFGLRPGEALALTQKDFEWGLMRLKVSKSLYNGTVKSTKTNKIRYVPIPGNIIPELQGLLAKRKGFYVFEPLPSKNSYDAIRRRILRAINGQMGGKGALKLTDMTLYTFRHDYASRLYFYGIRSSKLSYKMAAAIMGHSEEIFIQTYSHLMEDVSEVSEVFSDLATGF